MAAAPRDSVPILSIGLMLRDQPVLVVGGGKIAAQKTRHLCAAEAKVTIVAPEICPAMAELVDTYDLHHLPIEYDASALKGQSIVFVATNDRKLNARVLSDARKAGVLCNAADANWRNGDFITPAVHRHGNLTLAISTGGASCRRSKLVRDSISRHLDLLDGADLLVIGSSHEELSIGCREEVSLEGDRLQEVGDRISRIWGLHEFLILSTCNRTELYAIATADSVVADILISLMGIGDIPEASRYLYRGADAFAHTARVSAGLHSQTPGENHIVAQVKGALERARTNGWAGALMEGWIGKALAASKEIRAVTAPVLKEVEVEHVCRDYLLSEDHLAGGRSLAILGTGAIGRGLVEEIGPGAERCLWFYRSRRPELPPEADDRVELLHLSALEERLPAVDVLISAVTAEDFVVSEGQAASLNHSRKSMVIDLSVPRSIDPALGEHPGIKLVNLDDLKHWHRRNTADMEEVHRLAAEVIAEHQQGYDKIVETIRGRRSK